jgi:hypothetical protein
MLTLKQMRQGLGVAVQILYDTHLPHQKVNMRIRARSRQYSGRTDIFEENSCELSALHRRRRLVLLFFENSFLWQADADVGTRFGVERPTK